MLVATTPLLELVEQIVTGLGRKSAQTAVRWSTQYLRIPDARTREILPVSFQYYPWAVEVGNYDGCWVSPKAAQMGLTQIALFRALFLIDVRKTSVAYFLPKARPDAQDLSKGRFDPLVEASPHLQSLFRTNNVGHKQAGAASLYIRGMMSMSSAKSIPVGAAFFDEYDEMMEKVVAQAEERLSGQFVKQWAKFSTPTIPKKRIDLAFQNSTQEEYIFRCPHCGRFTGLKFPDSLKVYADSVLDRAGLAKSHYTCEHGCTITQEDKFNGIFEPVLTGGTARWASQANMDAEVRGFHINQFYSFTQTPAEIAVKAINATSAPEKEQEYHNSVGGRPVIPKGSALTQSDLDACRGNYLLGESHPNGRIVTMGVDIGNVINFTIRAWDIPSIPGADVNTAAHAQTLLYGGADHFEELDDLMRQWQVHYCVVDANPERRKATEFANRFEGYVSLCTYLKGLTGKTISTQNNDPGEPMVSVDRTNWLDTTLNRYRRRQIQLPSNVSREYCSHLCALIKRYGQDTTGNTVAKYINAGADHYGHAENYAEIALPLALARSENRNVESFL